jgi:hypothetical protein
MERTSPGQLAHRLCAPAAPYLLFRVDCLAQVIHLLLHQQLHAIGGPVHTIHGGKQPTLVFLQAKGTTLNAGDRESTWVGRTVMWMD